MAPRWRTRLLAHLEMMRPYTVFHAGMVALAGAVVATGGRARPRTLALVAGATTLGWIAGLYAGDYYDREIDAIGKPYRPVPSGRVAPREALASMCAYIALGYLCALALSVAHLCLAVGTTVMGIAYARTFKEKAILGNFDRGLLGAFAVLFGALPRRRGPAFASPGDDLAPGPAPEGVIGALGPDSRLPAVLALALLIFFHDASTNLVGAIRDVEGDRAAGCPTVPVVYGLSRAVAIACTLALCSLALSLLLFWRLLPRRTYALLLYAAAAALALSVYCRLWTRRHAMTRPLALEAHKALVVERLLLGSAVAGTSLPARTTLPLLATAIAVTTGAQAALRNRYEYDPDSRHEA
jgi:4-hydroxybenzoate polyprenyltransferase/geranylgeranylglycerol-phosphate geranylgeranyltransferase